MQWGLPPFVTIILPMILPLAQLFLVGGPISLYYMIYIFSVD